MCYVDSISAPSIQNVLPTRNRIYYEEATQSTVAPDLSGPWVWSNTSTTNSAVTWTRTGDLTYTYPSSSGTTAQITVTSHASQLKVTVGNTPIHLERLCARKERRLVSDVVSLLWHCLSEL